MKKLLAILLLLSAPDFSAAAPRFDLDSIKAGGIMEASGGAAAVPLLRALSAGPSG